MAQPRILLFGAGSIGSVYTYFFTKAGAEVTVVCRSNYTAVKENGFTINSAVFGDVTVKPQVISTPSEATGTYDFVVISSKSFPGSEPTTAALLKPAITSSNTAIVLIQNGIGIEDEYKELYPENPLLSCVVYLPVTQTSPGVVAQYAPDELHVGTYPANAPSSHKSAAEIFVSIIKHAGGNVLHQEDIQRERWNKLLLNASWNPICALSKLRDVQFLNSSEPALSYVRSVMEEVASIAQALGHKDIGTEQIEAQLKRATSRTEPGIQPSMQADALMGRRIEVEAILGNAVRKAQKLGIETKLLFGLYMLSKGLDDSIRRALDAK